MTSSTFWDQEKFEKGALGKHPEWLYNFAQSKGRAPMKVCPLKGDTVLFVWKGHIRMRGVVVSDGFIAGVAHQHHACNIGAKRPHTEKELFALINITGPYTKIPIRPTGQRTWAKYVEAP
jgi:hypothetical protein